MNATQHLLVRARALTGFKELVISLGGNAENLLTRAGIDSTLLEQPETTLPLIQLVELLDSAGKALAVPDIGLQLARHQDISVLGPVAIIALHSDTVGQALEGISRHLPYHTPGVTLTVVTDQQTQLSRLRFVIAVGTKDIQRQGVELSYGVTYGFLRMIANRDPSDWRIHFRHALGLDADEYGRHFACPVVLGQEHDELIFPATVLDLPVDQARTDLRAMAERFLSNIIRRHPLDIGRQVETLIDRQLALGGGSIQRIADQLGLHRRTLQRRLAEKGLYFEDILDAVRVRRAREYLHNAALPLIQVAHLIGYNDQASLNRSCLRWFGMTPKQVRSVGS